jgi:hypothetical protein
MLMLEKDVLKGFKDYWNKEKDFSEKIKVYGKLKRTLLKNEKNKKFFNQNGRVLVYLRSTFRSNFFDPSSSIQNSIVYRKENTSNIDRVSCAFPQQRTCVVWAGVSFSRSFKSILLFTITTSK